MTWRIEFDLKAKKELLRLDKQTQKRIISFLEERILKLSNPRTVGRALHNKLSGLWRYRVGDCRIICRIYDKQLVVLIVSIGHRKNIYDKIKT